MKQPARTQSEGYDIVSIGSPPATTNGRRVTSTARASRLPLGEAQKIWTAEELEQMTPAEQDAIFDASIVRHLDEVPEEFLARVRARFETHRAGTESPASDRWEANGPGDATIFRGSRSPVASRARSEW